MAFYDIEDNENYFGNVAEMICHYFASGDSETDEEIWYKMQNLNECQIDPLRIVECDYRPFTKKQLYYGDRMGLVSHPRYEVMKHLLPWYWEYTIMRLCARMENHPLGALNGIIEYAERCWFDLPLNAKFLANLNVWRVAIFLRSTEKQLSLF